MYRLCFFFFQAEDGIRDLTVTGVQTCALPISKVGSEKAVGLARVTALQPANAQRERPADGSMCCAGAPGVSKLAPERLERCRSRGPLQPPYRRPRLHVADQIRTRPAGDRKSVV